MKKFQEFLNENFTDEARAYLDYIFKNLKKEPADDFPEERIFYRFNDDVYFEYDIPSKNIWPSDEIYKNLKKAFYLVDSEIRDLLKEYCKKYLDVEVRLY